MATLTEMVARFKERIDDNPKLQEFVEETKIKLDKEKQAKLEVSLKMETLLKDKFKIDTTKIKKTTIDNNMKLNIPTNSGLSLKLEEFKTKLAKVKSKTDLEPK